MHIYDIYFSLSELVHSDTLQYRDQECDSGRLGSTHNFSPIPSSFPVHCFLLDSHQHHKCLQWLRLCTVSIPGWGTKTLHTAWSKKKKKKNPLKKEHMSACGKGNPLLYPCLGIPMDRGAWWATVHGVTKSWT